MSETEPIRYGIDLGTTNSSIAILRGDDVLVVPSKYDMRITPSMVWFSAKGAEIDRVEVGSKARQQLPIVGADLIAQRFKSQMGEPTWRFRVPGSGRMESACDLSARVLRELVDSLARLGGLPPLSGAVVTVPAIFQTPAREDTLRAGEMAGISYVQLLAEPEAAALAYGQKIGGSGSGIWLVYDLGGGTFDAALVRVEDGIFTKIDTDGDRNLGGSDLDALIVKEVMLAQLPRPLRAKVLEQVNGGPSAAWWHLLQMAEEAKKELDVAAEARMAEVVQGVDVELKVLRDEVETLQVKAFARTLTICGRLLERNHLEAKQVERVVLVGGPTRSPFLRTMIERGQAAAAGRPAIAGMGIALDASVDPMTAVAQGAALYAASQRMPQTQRKTPVGAAASGVTIESSTPSQVLPDDSDLIIAARVRPTMPGLQVDEQWAVVVERLDGRAVGWHSEPIRLKPNGGFLRQVKLQPGQNFFQMRVFDAEQRVVVVDAGATLEVTRGIKVGEMTLDRGIGIANARGETEWFFKKDDGLPTGPRTLSFKTTVALSRESSDDVVVPIVEGFEVRANLNTDVYTLRIRYASVGHAIPLGSPLDITLSIDRNSMLHVSVEFTDFKIVVEPNDIACGSDIDDIRKKLALAKANLALFRDVRNQSKAIDQVVAEVEESETIAEIEALLDEGTPEQRIPWSKARTLVVDVLKAQAPYMDEVDALLKWERVSARCNENMRKGRSIVAETGGLETAWLAEFESLCRRYDEAVERKDSREAELVAFSLAPGMFHKAERLVDRVNNSGGSLSDGLDERRTGWLEDKDGTLERK